MKIALYFFYITPQNLLVDLVLRFNMNPNTTINALLLSSSKVDNNPYLLEAKPLILEMLSGIDEVLFIPYAGVSISWDQYTQKVANALPELNISGVHTYDSALDAIKRAKAVLVGGGNTFNLLHTLQEQDLVRALQESVLNGCKYIGWSAGSNIAGLSIKTTNDMPIVQPQSFDGLSFINAQINPHYTDYVAPNHNGETRDQRIQEFCILSPEVSVIGIKEGSAIQIKGTQACLLGKHQAYIFKGLDKRKCIEGSDLSKFLF